jgi:subtilisin-like proprotein convertase family protein
MIMKLPRSETMKTKLALLAAFTTGLSLQFCPQAVAAFVTASSPSAPTVINYNLTGLGEQINLSTSMTSISGVEVSLDIAGGYNGNYYAFLAGPGGGFAVLLNRVGVTAGNAYGSSDSGFNVTFSDTAVNGNIDYATAGGGTVTGAWQPDARNVSPLSSGSVLDGSPRTAGLSSFNGLNPNGNWTLLVADVSPGGIGTLEGWGLTVSGGAAAVPEPSTGLAALITLALTALGPVLRLRNAIAGGIRLSASAKASTPSLSSK